MASVKNPRWDSLYYSSAKWKVFNYLHGFPGVGGRTESREFTANLHEPIKFKLGLLLSEQPGKLYRLQGLLTRSQTCSGSTHVNVKVRIVVYINKVVQLYHQTHKARLSKGAAIVFDIFDISQNVIQNYQRNLKAASIKIICDFLRGDLLSTYLTSDMKCLLDDLKTIHNTGKFSDLVLKVKNQTISVHAAIAKARCPYIRHVLDEEPHRREINLTGMIMFDPLIALSRYWYTGDIEGIPRKASVDTNSFVYNMEQSELTSYIDPETIKLTKNFNTDRESIWFVIDNIDFIENLNNLQQHAPLEYTCEVPNWKLTFLRKSIFGEDSNISLLIENTNPNVVEKPVYLEAFLVDELLKEYGLKGTISWLHLPDTFPFIEFMTREEFAVIKDILLKNNSLRIGCRTYTGNDDVRNKIEIISDPEIAALPKENPYFVLAEHLKKLFQSEDMSNMSLIADGRKFRVHKFILAARSVYFNTLFTEPETSEISELIIDDIVPDDLSTILKYVYYAETVDLNPEFALKLYPVCRKYKIARLYTLYSEYLQSHLTLDNAVDIIELANMFEDLSLKEMAFKYIQANSSRMLHTERWGRLMNDNSQLSSEIISQLGQKQIGSDPRDFP